MARSRDYKAEYANRVSRLKSLGFSTKQARGHAGKNEPSVKEARSVAARYEIPIASAAKIPKTAKIEKFDQQGTFRIVETAPVFDLSRAQRMIDMGGPKYVGTSARIRLKNGKYYQTRTFGTASMGQNMMNSISGKYGFDENDIEDVEFFNTEGV